MVGTRSYGKGVFQQEIGLSNGGALKLTIGEYFTPDGVNLAKSHGIHPDVKARDRNPRDEARTRARGTRIERCASGALFAPGQIKRTGRSR